MTVSVSSEKMIPAASNPAPATDTVFIGRQPIFDRRRNVFGYELLYRSGGTTNAYTGTDGEAATRRVLYNSLNVVGLPELTGSKQAFINCTGKTILNEEYLVLPAAGSVIELLETVLPTPEILAALKRLKDAGYTLALDDFAFGPEYRAFLPYADILKVDFLATTPEQRRQYSHQYGNKGKTLLLAEKIESHAEFEEAAKLGYVYFQGYFFSKPEIIARKDIPAFKRNCLKFIQEVNAPDISFERLEEVVKHDPALSTKLLRYLNSAAFGLTHRISSIRQALALLGQKPLRKWASLIGLSELGRDKPTELLTLALVRARFCELLIPHIGLRGRELDGFIMGLLSAVDAFTDQPLAETIAQIPMTPDVAAALLGEDNDLGKAYALALSLEQHSAPRIAILLSKFNLSLETVSTLYRQAIVWADQSVMA